MEMNQQLFDRLYDNNDYAFAESIESQYTSHQFSFSCPNQEANFCDALACSFVNSLRKLPNAKSDYLFSLDAKFYKPILLVSKAIELVQVKEDPEYVGAQREDLGAYYGNLGIFYSLQDRYCEALMAFNRSLAICPENGLFRFDKIEMVKDYLPMLIHFCQLDPLFNYFEDQLFLAKRTPTNQTDPETKVRIDNYLAKMKPVEHKYDETRFQSNPDQNIYAMLINPVSDLVPLEGLSDIAINDLHDDPLYKELGRSYSFIRMERQQVQNGRYDPKIVDRKLANLFSDYYSMFDKVAYFLSKHYSLDISDRNANIVNVFEEKYGLLKHKNPFLFCIFWISKEFRAKTGEKINPYLPSDFTDIANLRNQIEHRCEPLENFSSYQITRCCNKMEEIARDMLVYIQLMVMADDELKAEFGSDWDSKEYHLPRVDISSFFLGCIRG